MTQEAPKPVEMALDLFVYAPVGLAITAAEELPKLAAKGRTRVNTQLMMARVVGRFAVDRGRRELEKRFAEPTRAPARPAPVSRDAPDHGASSNGKGEALTLADEPGVEVVQDGGAVTVSIVGDLDAAAPEQGELAIPGYDSLSASQVVQRLAGLDRDELAAVGAYEHAHRGRRTILNRIAQLQGQ